MHNGNLPDLEHSKSTMRSSFRILDFLREGDEPSSGYFYLLDKSYHLYTVMTRGGGFSLMIEQAPSYLALFAFSSSTPMLA
jgi:hypothetical protein